MCINVKHKLKQFSANYLLTRYIHAIEGQPAEPIVVFYVAHYKRERAEVSNNVINA